MLETFNIDYSPTTIAATVILFVLMLYFMANRGLPPGPIGIPFLGYYLFLDPKSYYLQLQELAKKYGDVFSVRVTGQLYIHLSSLKALKEAHVSKADCFNSRMKSYSMMKYIVDKGVTYENGEPWKVLRKFFILNLREYGLTSFKGQMVDDLMDSLHAVTEEIRNLNGQVFDSSTLLTKFCTLTMRQLIFSGVEIPEDDVTSMMEAYEGMVNTIGGKAILLSGPVSEHVIVPLVPKIRVILPCKKKMDEILLRIIRDHESTFKDQQPRDIIDCYIHERRIRTKNKDPTAAYFTDEALVGSLVQFVGDGALGVGFFISTFLDTLVKHPDVQEKIYSEILDVIGRDRLPTGEDRSKLPYTNAAMLEMLRCSDFFPVFPSLECTKETTLNGYRIPKGSVTLVSHWSIHHDPESYENPDSFDPERYISKPNKPKAEHPVIFGVGKRACAGESFAMMQAFLFLVTIVKTFKLISPPEEEKKTIFQIRICALPRS